MPAQPERLRADEEVVGMSVKTDYKLSELVSLEQAGFELRLSVQRVRQLIDRGLLDCVRDSTRRRMVVKASVLKLIEQRMGQRRVRAGAR
jgi:hypothetical protein